MKYTKKQVLDILKIVSNDPKSVFDQWVIKNDNVYLDLSKYKYPLFIYSFPIEIGGELVATITLSQITNTGIDSQRDMLMSKYLTTDSYNKSWFAYSHETYKDCYLTIHKEFQLPPHPKDNNFKILESHFLDASGNKIEYCISCGDSEIDGLFESYTYEDRIISCYRFDNGVNIQIKSNIIDGWIMGEKINEEIKIRLRDQKIKEINEENIYNI